MSNTYTLLESISVGAAGAASVTFNSIPQTGYTDLVVKASTRSGSGAAVAYSMLMKINSLTSSIYSQRAAEGNGAAASSFNQSGIDSAVRVALVNGTGATASTFSSTEITIPNYASSNYKSVSIDSVAETNATTTYMNMLAYLVQTTDAVSSLTFAPESAAATFAQYSTFSLYGVSALGTTPTKAPKATGGSIIQTDGTYWYHAFLSSGTFTPATALSCDVLVVAGGGGGGLEYAGGGGAGGVAYQTGRSVSIATTVTLGAGGARATSSPSRGSTGSNSVFDTITADGGGGGGGWGGSVNIGASGGSGGGGSMGVSSNTTAAGGSATQGTSGGATGYGFAGGAGARGTAFVGGGGGGSGAVGQSRTITDTVGGAGGAGLNTWSTWLSTTGLGVSGYIAGGGGGVGVTTGVGGSGGGGNGALNTAVNATAATANTGSGGGGGYELTNGTSAAGGSGLVIIRYLAA